MDKLEEYRNQLRFEAKYFLIGALVTLVLFYFAYSIQTTGIWIGISWLILIAIFTRAIIMVPVCIILAISTEKDLDKLKRDRKLLSKISQATSIIVAVLLAILKIY